VTGVVGGIPSAEAFSVHAGEYTAQRRRLIPVYDAFYGAVLDVLRLAGDGGMRRVLDLGAGTGLLSAEIVRAFPAVSIDLLDGSEPMLAEARERLGAAMGAAHVADMAGPLPAGPFDAVVSAMAIHHLEHADKRALMARAFDLLRPGGVFVNAEQVSAAAPEMTEIYQARWEEECRALGATGGELADTRERMRHDRCTDVETQLRWLREAGFAPVDCVYKHWRFAVMAGFKEGGS
jgi:tRNA (cmo5U34)-methyltransferase